MLNLTSCYAFATHVLAATVIKLNEVFCNLEALQRISLIALAILREINFHCRTPYFPHAVELLDTAAPTFDFYGIYRLPHLFFYPYAVERLDEYAILDQLEVILCNHWHLGTEDSEGQNRDPHVRQFAKEQLKSFLEKMEEHDLDFRSAEEVRTTLQNWFKKTLEVDPKEDFDPYSIHLQDLQIVLKKKSLLETLTTYIFFAVDIVCVPDFLEAWGLINLASYVQTIGRLDDWVWRMASVGYFLQFLRASYSLWKGQLTPDEAKDMKWLMVASLAESLYSLSIVQKRDARLINYLALVAKSLGLIACLVASKPTFFNDD